MRKALLIPAPSRGPHPRIRTPKQRAPRFGIQPRKIAAVPPIQKRKPQSSGSAPSKKKKPQLGDNLRRQLIQLFGTDSSPSEDEAGKPWKLIPIDLPPVEFFRPPLNTLPAEDPRRSRAIEPRLQEQAHTTNACDKATQTEDCFYYYGPPSPEPGPAIPEGYYGPLRVTLTAPHITFAERGPRRR